MKIRAIAKTTIDRRFAVVLFGEKLAVAFSRDSGAKVGYNATLISGDISSGGSRQNWYCRVDSGTIFELEIDEEIFNKNKNRIKNWDLEVIEDFSITKERSEQLLHAQQNLE